MWFTDQLHNLLLGALNNRWLLKATAVALGENYFPVIEKRREPGGEAEGQWYAILKHTLPANSSLHCTYAGGKEQGGRSEAERGEW